MYRHTEKITALCALSVWHTADQCAVRRLNVPSQNIANIEEKNKRFYIELKAYLYPTFNECNKCKIMCVSISWSGANKLVLHDTPLHAVVL